MNDIKNFKGAASGAALRAAPAAPLKLLGLRTGPLDNGAGRVSLSFRKGMVVVLAPSIMSLALSPPNPYLLSISSDRK